MPRERRAATDDDGDSSNDEEDADDGYESPTVDAESDSVDDDEMDERQRPVERVLYKRPVPVVYKSIKRATKPADGNDDWFNCLCGRWCNGCSRYFVNCGCRLVMFVVSAFIVIGMYYFFKGFSRAVFRDK